MPETQPLLQLVHLHVQFQQVLGVAAQEAEEAGAQWGCEHEGYIWIHLDGKCAHHVGCEETY